MDVICISNREPLISALQQHCGKRVHLYVVGSFLSCLEVLNAHVPKAIIIDMADPKIDDYDMITMFPPEDSAEYIPLISIAMQGGAGAIGDSVEDTADINLLAAHLMYYIEGMLF